MKRGNTRSKKGGEGQIREEALQHQSTSASRGSRTGGESHEKNTDILAFDPHSMVTRHLISVQHSNMTETM